MANLLFCLQCCPIDCDAAVELAQLISDIQKVLRPRQVPWLISYRKDTPLSRIESIKASLLKVFDRVHVAQAQRFASGWPAGSNALWRCSMENAWALKEKGEVEADGVLTFEPDCTPLMLTWIDRLEDAYGRRSQPVVGNVHDGGSDIARHINGNAMFPIRLAADHPEILNTPMGVAWDFYHRDEILGMSEDTPAITQYYRRKAFTEAEWLNIQKSGARPALLHGVKDRSARALARVHLLGTRTVQLTPQSPQRPAKRALQRPV